MKAIAASFFIILCGSIGCDTASSSEMHDSTEIGTDTTVHTNMDSADQHDTHDNGGGTTDTVAQPDITEEVDTGPIVDSCEKLRMIEGEWRATSSDGTPIAGKATMVISLSPEGTQCRVTMTGYVYFKGDLFGTEVPLERLTDDGRRLILVGDGYQVSQKEADVKTNEETFTRAYAPECASAFAPASCSM